MLALEESNCELPLQICNGPAGVIVAGKGLLLITIFIVLLVALPHEFVTVTLIAAEALITTDCVVSPLLHK